MLLSDRIMSLKVGKYLDSLSEGVKAAYRNGHKVARHDAAEICIEAEQLMDEMECALDQLLGAYVLRHCEEAMNSSECENAALVLEKYIAYRYPKKKGQMHNDLKWLALNVYQWPAIKKSGHYGVGWNDIGKDGCNPDFVFRVNPTSAYYSYEEWIQARKDLGLEPSGIAEPDEDECMQLAYERMSKQIDDSIATHKQCDESTSDGSTASYYELPEGCTQLQDLISFRNLNAQDGEIFRAIYRKGRASHSDELRDARKVLFYAQAEVARLEKKCIG